MRYSLEDVFGSPEKKLCNFESRRVTKNSFEIFRNKRNMSKTLIILDDEETIIEMTSGSGG